MVSPQSPDRSDAEVSLVFPPLVTTNFGNYYPSTAVLSGYLKSQGVDAHQADLNERFAHYLLEPNMLVTLGNGHFPGTEPHPLSDKACVSARLLTRLRDCLFDEHGRDRFQNNAEAPTHLLTHLADPFHVHLDFAALQKDGFFEAPITEFYSAFYRWSGYIDHLPQKVHTVGISVPLGPQLVPALILARDIKTQRPDITVVLGGPTLSLLHIQNLEILLKEVSAIDAVIRFEGELPFHELVSERRQGNQNFQTISSVSCLKNGRFFHNDPKPGMALKSMPFSEYDKGIMSSLSDPEIGIIQARGCYWGKCAYCDYVELYKGSPRYRTQYVSRFIDEMKYQMEEHQRHRFAIITESIPSAFARKMSQAILEEGLDLRWSSFAMVDKNFTPETFELIAKGGCDYLEIGVETMNNRVLKLVKKAATTEENQRFIKLAASVGVKLKINIIPDLPSTSYEEALQSLQLFSSLKDCIHRIGVYPFEPTKSSNIGRDPSYYSLKLIDDADMDGQAQFPANHLNAWDPAMTQEQRKEIHQRFFEFRDHHNAHLQTQSANHFITEQDEDGPYMQFADTYVDILQTEDGFRCYHALTQRNFSLSSPVAELLTLLESGQPFKKQDLVSCFAQPEDGQAFFQKMVTHRMLKRCDTKPLNQPQGTSESWQKAKQLNLSLEDEPAFAPLQTPA